MIRMQETAAAERGEQIGGEDAPQGVVPDRGALADLGTELIARGAELHAPDEAPGGRYVQILRPMYTGRALLVWESSDGLRYLCRYRQEVGPASAPAHADTIVALLSASSVGWR
jgi:hypothetical protein